MVDAWVWLTVLDSDSIRTRLGLDPHATPQHRDRDQLNDYLLVHFKLARASSLLLILLPANRLIQGFRDVVSQTCFQYALALAVRGSWGGLPSPVPDSPR